MAPQGKPDVAVIIAVWNAQGTLGRAIDSVLAQTGVSLEVLIVNDASTDGTRAVAQSYAARDPRVRVLAQTRNAGPAAARNMAMDAAQARYVTPLDSDDFMAPDRLAQLLRIADAGGWDMVGDDLWKVEEQAIDGPRTRLWTENEIGIEPLDLTAFVLGNLSSLHGGKGELGFLKPLMSREFLNAHRLRYDSNMRLGEDYLLYASALALGARFCLTDPAGYVAVGRATSLSGRHTATDLGGLVAADRTLLARPDLPRGARTALRRHSIDTQKKWHWMRLIDAVKARDVGAALGCFKAPPAVIAALLGKLGEQVVLRSRLRPAPQRSAQPKGGRP